MNKKYLLFFGVCVIIRSLFVVLAKFISKNYLNYLGYIAIIPALGFFSNYFLIERKTGIFGQKAWWHELRIVHSVLYFLFANYAIKKKSYSYIPLAVDVIIGIIAFTIKHFY